MENKKIKLSENDILLKNFKEKNEVLNLMNKELKILKSQIFEKMGNDDILRSKHYIANLKLQDRKGYQVKPCTIKILKVNSIV